MTSAPDFSSSFGASAPDKRVSSNDRRDFPFVQLGREESLKRSVPGPFRRAASILRREGELHPVHTMEAAPTRQNKSVTPQKAEVLTAGHPGVYGDLEVGLLLLFVKPR